MKNLLTKKLLLIFALLAFLSPLSAGDLEDGIKAYENEDYATAYQKLLPLAEKGDADAQYYLGNMYLNGNGVKKDNKKAFRWYEKSAKQNHISGQTALSIMYKYGEGVEKNYVKAFEWMKKAAEQDYPFSFYAQAKLAEMYYFGHGVKQDYKKAAQWYQKLAEKGHSTEQFILGNMYEAGHGVKQDYKKAFQWMKKAAEQNLPEAQYFLGLMYYNGRGVEPNWKEAVEWFKKAAEQNSIEALYSLGLAYENSSGRVSTKEAIRVHKLAAEQGHTPSQFRLFALLVFNYDNALEDYLNYPNDPAVLEALMWLVISTSFGNVTAKETLEEITERAVFLPYGVALFKKVNLLAKQCVAKKFKNCYKSDQ